MAENRKLAFSRIKDFALIRKDTGQRIPLVWHILNSVMTSYFYEQLSVIISEDNQNSFLKCLN